ncbi:MAG: hypothetical protein CO090_10515 [Acidobacteria bacterium CG_4_9_14_3_um_filter_49_7]|nr:MAG: hypothetical protein CO090_10515 [Acidobacteria bacterium CG_4_9_14_3_um_filter_49_7]
MAESIRLYRVTQLQPLRGRPLFNDAMGWKLGASSYVLASFVGWSRYHARKHYTNDILRGAAIGIAGAYLFARPIGKHAVMAPLLGPGTLDVMVSARW